MGILSAEGVQSCDLSLCVYIPPRADATTACEKIHTVTAKLQTQHPEAFIIISGDFNHITLDSHQVVDCPTRNNRTIELLYTNVKEAYRVTALPQLGMSDHNLVYIQPQYNPGPKAVCHHMIHQEMD